MEFRIPAWVDPARLDAGEDQTCRHRLVCVASDQEVLRAAGNGEHALTDKELPQVEKKACSAPTASAMSSSARDRSPADDSRSSRPPVASMSARNGSSPSTSFVSASAPLP